MWIPPRCTEHTKTVDFFYGVIWNKCLPKNKKRFWFCKDILNIPTKTKRKEYSHEYHTRILRIISYILTSKYFTIKLLKIRIAFISSFFFCFRELSYNMNIIRIIFKLWNCIATVQCDDVPQNKSTIKQKNKRKNFKLLPTNLLKKYKKIV